MQSKPLTFADLKIGDYFIDFPTDGDDKGHSGYKGGYYVFRKKRKTKYSGVQENAFNIKTGTGSLFTNNMQVLKVII